MIAGHSLGAAEFPLRALVVAALVLLVGRALEMPAARAAAPLLRTLVEGSSGDFTVTAVGTGDTEAGRALWLRANLRHPVVVGGKQVLPFGWVPGTEGGIQVALTMGGLLLDAQLLLVIVLAWPAGSRAERWRRALLALPVAVLIWLLLAFVTTLAELWYPLHNAYAPGETWPLLALSRTLMAGGSEAVAIAGAVAVLVAARRVASARDSSTTQARVRAR